MYGISIIIRCNIKTKINVKARDLKKKKCKEKKKGKEFRQKEPSAKSQLESPEGKKLNIYRDDGGYHFSEGHRLSGGTTCHCAVLD